MNKSVIVSALSLVLALGIMIWGFREPVNAPAGSACYYALLTEDLGTDVMQFKQGAQAAAKELGAGVTFMTCARIDPIGGELASFVTSLGPLSPEGIILPPGGEDVLADALKLGTSVVCLFETDAHGASSVVTDFTELGEQLAKRALEQENPTGFAAFLTNTREETQMLAGLKSVLGASVQEFTVDSPESAFVSARALPGGTCAFALNAELTLALANDAGGLRIWGVDPGEARVELLVGGAAAGLAMQMPYAQGYQAIMAAAQSSPGSRVTTPSRVITADEMYLSENVKLMFPLLQ